MYIYVYSFSDVVNTPCKEPDQPLRQCHENASEPFKATFKVGP